MDGQVIPSACRCPTRFLSGRAGAEKFLDDECYKKYGAVAPVGSGIPVCHSMDSFSDPRAFFSRAGRLILALCLKKPFKI
jgi:hypothetical protein